jgi:hypothetical protein
VAGVQLEGNRVTLAPKLECALSESETARAPRNTAHAPCLAPLT